ncbi:MAG TPA: GumC family protein, partial [Polyangiaceae bacterium]|nr:GumC family protein [Polyangiaceae bacterium]
MPIKPLVTQQAASAPRLDVSKVFFDAWKVLRKRWAWAITIAVLVVAGAAFYTAGQKRIYLASCTIQIDPKPPKPLGQDVQAIVDVGSSAYWANAEYYKTQFQIIQSQAVAEETVRRLGLNRDVAFLRRLGPKDPPPAPGAAESVSVEAAAGIVRRGLSVEPVKESRLVVISYRDPNPERARQLVAAVVSVYMDRNIDVALESTNTAADWLQGQVQNLKQELEGSELALHEYKKSNRLLSVSLDDQSNMLRQEMQQLSAALTAVRVRRSQVAAQAEELSKLDLSTGGTGLPDSELLRDPTLQHLRQTLGEAIAERDSLVGSGKGEMHPLVASASARVKAADQALTKEIQNVRQAAQLELAVVNHEVESLSKLFEEAQQRALEIGGLELDYRRMERSKSNTEKLYSLVIERSKETDLTRMMRFN